MKGVPPSRSGSGESEQLSAPSKMLLAAALIVGPNREPPCSPEEIAASINQTLGRLFEAVAKMIGPVGFLSLSMRALYLSREQFPWLAETEVQIGDDVALEGLESISQLQSEAELRAGATMFVTHLLELLCSFIGENLTLRLICRGWPEHVESLGFDAEGEVGG